MSKNELIAIHELDDSSLEAASGGFFLSDWFNDSSRGIVDASGPGVFGAGAILDGTGRNAWYPNMGPVPDGFISGAQSVDEAGFIMNGAPSGIGGGTGSMDYYGATPDFGFGAPY